MTSTAFFSCTACTAPSTLRGSCGWAFRRTAVFLDTLVFTMQVVYRSIQMMFLDVPCNARWNEIVNRQPAREALADHRRRHVARMRVNEEDSRRTFDSDIRVWRWRDARAQLRDARVCLVDRHSWPCDDDEMGEIQHPRISMP